MGRWRVGVASVVVAAVLAGGAAGAGTLFQPYEQVYGTGTEAVAVGDVTGDGRADLVFPATGTSPVAVGNVWVMSDVDGELRIVASYDIDEPQRPTSIAVGDVTADGRNDIVLGLAGGGVVVYPIGAPGPFRVPTANSGTLRLGDLNGDGRLDVASVGWGTNSVDVLLSDGAGGLSAPVSHVARHAGYEDLEVGDVTGDGRDDIVVMSGQDYSVPNVSVLAQLPGGGFASAAEYRVGPNLNTQGIGVGDVTGDGRNDVVASYGGNAPNARLAVFAQTATGTLAPPVAYPTSDIPEPVEVADFDGDGRADVATLHGGWLKAGVHLQRSDGTLGAEDTYPIPYASHYGVHGLASGDLNGDGARDLAFGDTNGVHVLFNTDAAPPPPPPTADVGVDVAATATLVKRGKSFAFTAHVTNAGPDATAATLTVTLSGPAAGVAADNGACAVSGLSVTCQLSSLAAGGATTVRVYGTAVAKGKIVATGAVDGAAADPNAANDGDSASVTVR